MKCEGCGADLAEGAKFCNACGRTVSLGHRVGDESVHVAKEAGAAVEKVGKGIVGGFKSIGAGAKKGLKGSSDEKKAP